MFGFGVLYLCKGELDNSRRENRVVDRRVVLGIENVENGEENR